MKSNYQYCPWSLICQPGFLGPNSLFLGDAQAAKNPKFIQGQSIKTVLSVGSQAIPTTKFKAAVQYYAIQLRDQKTENIEKHFKYAIQVIEEGRKKGNILVHCFHGASRSSTLIIAYLIQVGKMKFEQAYKYTKQRRPSVSPNQGFIKQLIEFSKKCEQSKTDIV